MVATAAKPIGGTTPLRRVLITGINYTPEITGIAPYTAGLAEHLVRRGVEVSVVAGMPYYPQWHVLEGYQGRLRSHETINGVEVRHFRQYVPRRQSVIRRLLFEASYVLHPLPFLNGPRPDVVLGVLPNLGGGLLAAEAARRHRVPFGLLFQDLTGRGAGQSGIPGGTKVARLTKEVEGWMSRRAQGVAIVAEGFRPYFEEMGVEPARIHRIRNWTHVGKPKRSREETRRRLGLPLDAAICLHAGNMGFKQGLENVLECANLAARRDPSLLFVMMGNGNQRDHLLQRAAGMSNVRSLPAQSDEDFPDVLGAADVLLVNQRASVTDMSLPGKLTSYFAAGRPVVAAVAVTSETAAELSASGAGVVVDAGKPDHLLAAIRGLVADPERADAMGRCGQVYADENLTADGALAQIEGFLAGLMDQRARTSNPHGARFAPRREPST
jgi:glycosyltransferase involved in cell wall biosynthesis